MDQLGLPANEPIKRSVPEIGQFVDEAEVRGAVEETTDYHHLFTPGVIAELDRISAGIKSGVKTFSQEEVDEHFRNKSHAWRDTRAG